ncbi:MAG: hypothetical protein K0Q59_2443, partial [Paenibacillus sp.]|nr:hypothetical protein [Paenibacillus sp.]
MSLCLVLGMLPGLALQANATANAWDGTVAAAFAGGGGTLSDPYEIATGEQLAYLASRVNGGVKYANEYFELTADIDLGGHEWIPIGENDSDGQISFQGIFDGRGHIISHLSMTSNIAQAGLFGRVQDAVIRNVGLEHVDIDIAETTLTGGLVAVVSNRRTGTLIENSYVTGTITTGNNVHVGGLVGRSSGPANGTIARSYSTANITAGVNGAKIGGLVGTTENTIVSNSYATGDLAGGGDKQRIGGLVGYTTTAISGTSYWNSDAVQTWVGSPVAVKLGVGYSTETSYSANASGSMSSISMKLADFVTALNSDSASNSVWKFSVGENGGYPVIDGVGVGRDGIAPSSPAISSQPVDEVVGTGGDAVFTVVATDAIVYQWQVNEGSGFVNIADAAPYSGATTATLSIAGASASMNGYTYRVVATGGANPAAVSDSAALTVVSKPAAPIVQAAIAGDAKVNLTWNAVSGATGYKVYRSGTAGSYGAEIATVSGAIYSYEAAGLVNGATYYFVVRATNLGGDSTSSNEVSATPQVEAPGAPTIVNTVAGNAKVNLTWNAVSGATGYKVYRSGTAGSYGAEIVSVSGAVYSYEASGLMNGTTYYFVVKATNAGGDSASSNEASATPQVEAPGSPTIVNAIAGDAKVNLTWNAVSGATGYKVYRSGTSGSYGAEIATVSGAVYSYEASWLVNGATYYFVVRATNAGGDSASSNEVSGTPQVEAPGSPTIVNTVAGNAKVNLAWNAVPGATGYKVYLSGT